jgi:hypothetical protein
MDDVDPSKERRIHSRTAARIPARLAQGGQSVEGVIENIGEGGVFFATEELETLLDETAPVTLSFALEAGDGGLEVERQGRVLRAERYFDGVAVVRAFAVKFDRVIELEGVHFG